MSNYYIISLKWTFPNSAAFTLWRENDAGYCWYKEWSGTHTEEEINAHRNYYDDKVDMIAVSADIVDKLWTYCRYDGRNIHLLLNTKETRKLLGIKKNQLKGGMSNIHMNQIEFIDEEAAS